MSKKKSSKSSILPQDIEEKRTRVSMQLDAPKNTESYDNHNVFSSLGFDNRFNLEDFKKNFQIKVISSSEEEAIFDLIGIDAAIANALRRITISEVPSMAIEHVFIVNNTSVIQDEVLAHRLGLIPIKVDPRKFDYRSTAPNQETQISDTDTISFSLDVTCTRNPKAPDDAQPDELYLNRCVYSRDLIWKPTGRQTDQYENIRPVHEDILLAKLVPGQNINLEVQCVKGIGKTHAKWQLVNTASYRLLPEIKIVEPITGDEAKKLVETCPMGVFDIEDYKKTTKAVVSKPRQCTMCRECIRQPEFADNIKLNRVKDHFICEILISFVCLSLTIHLISFGGIIWYSVANRDFLRGNQDLYEQD
eukprot:TRINITY_DN4237_c0_g1_i3.p1 TRINITY_DN4237_c0_g1~~TRINITY_DN4237_c0_g1_i3.p1  ORF type:complete len:362 (+),score=86.56 TRINITY_DN4237_c0_g1_i3:124-1209(+)